MEQYLDYGVLGLTIVALIAYGGFATAKWNEAVNERVKATEARLLDSEKRVTEAREYARGSEEMKTATNLAAQAIAANTRAIENMTREWGGK